MYHNNYIIFEKNKKYRWREQGFLQDDEGYYSQSPSGYLLVDHLDLNLSKNKNEQAKFIEGVRHLARFTRMINRTLIMPVLPCPSTVKASNCTMCAWTDTCAYGFQRYINFNYKAHVCE